MELPKTGLMLAEAAKVIGVSRGHIYQLAKQGKLQTFRGLEGRLRVSKEELHHYLRTKESSD